MRIFTYFILLTISVIAPAQTITPLMSASVKSSKLERDNTPILSADKVREGYYESVELLEIDNTLVLRCEEGKSNERGFVEEDSRHSIMFKVSGLTYEWIDPVKQEGVLFKGTCSSKQLGYDLPFVLQFNATGSDMLSVGQNVKALGEVRNYDLNRLFELGTETGNKTTTTPKASFKKKVIKIHKPKLTK